MVYWACILTGVYRKSLVLVLVEGKSGEKEERAIERARGGSLP